MLLWHPDVHRAYGEELFFFLVRSRFYGEEFKSTLRELLEERARGAWAFFETLGYYDALVRVWLSPGSYPTLRLRLQHSLHVLRIQDFRCASAKPVAYLWSPEFRQRPALEVTQILGFETSRLERAQSLPEGDPGREGLVEAGLILPDRIPDRSKSRFYCLVAFPGDGDFELDADKEEGLAELAQKREIHGLSVYTGDGFAKLLIKGSTPKIEAVHQFPFDLRQPELFGDKIRTETIIAGRPARVDECDHINFTAAETALGLQLRYAHLVGLSLPTRGQPSAKDLQDAFQKVEHLFSGDKEGYLKGLFRGWQGNSVAEIKSGAIPILELEGLLRDYFRGLMRRACGQGSVAPDLRDVASRAQLSEPAKKLEQFTLSELTRCLVVLDQDQRIGIERALGSTWNQELGRLEPIRNRCAHSLNDEARDPGQLVENLGSTLPMYYKLRAAVQNLRSDS